MNFGARCVSCLILGSSAAAGVHAATVYDVIDGSSSFITLQVYSSSGTLLASGSNSLPLTAPSELTADYAAMQIPAFLFEDMGTTTVGLSGAFTGDSIKLTNAAVTPGSPYSSSLTGSGPNYNYSLGALNGSVSSWAFYQGTTLKSSGGPTSGSTPGPLTGALTINGDSSITLDGIILGNVTIAGQSDVLKADVTFYGAPVPLPPAIWLLASALIGLGMASLRRRNAVEMFDTKAAGEALLDRKVSRVNRGLFTLGCALTVLIAQAAPAATVLNITGGGIDAGTINTCTAINNCGSTIAFSYQSGGNISGTITLTPTGGTTGVAILDLQLTSAANFSGGSGEELTAGTFTTPVLIPISMSGSTWSETGSPVYGVNSGIMFSSLTASENAPQISGLTCTLGALNVCGFFLGPTGFEMADSGGHTFDANLGFDVTGQVVPLPSSLWLSLSGIGFLWLALRNRTFSVALPPGAI